MDLAKIGFQADTSPLKTAADDLDAFKNKAKDTGEQLDKLNESAAKSGVAVTKSANAMKEAGVGALQAANDLARALADTATQSGKYGTVTQQIQEVVDKTGVSYAQANQAVKSANESYKTVGDTVKNSSNTFEKFSNAVRDSANATSISSAEAARSSGIWSSFANALGITSGSMGTNAAAAKNLAAEHKSASEFGTQFREVLHTLAPTLEATGLKISTLSRFSGAARFGLVGLAGAAGGALFVELEKAGNEAITLRQRLDGLAGVKIGGQLTSDLRDMSRELGVAPSVISPILETLIKLQQLHGPSNMLPPGMKAEFDDARIKAADLTRVIQTMFEQLRVGGASSSEATKAIDEFFTSVAKNGTLTGDALRRLQDAAPAAAQALTNAMTGGTKNAQEFAAQLDKTPVKFESVARALRQMRDTAQDAFQDLMDSPVKVSDAVDKLKGKYEELKSAIEDPDTDGKPNFITGQINALANDAATLAREIDELKGPVKDWGDIVRVATDQNSIWGKSVEIDLIGAFRKLNTDGSEQLRQFDQSILDTLSSAWSAIENFAAKVTGAAASVASSISSMAASGRAAGSSPQPQPQSILGQQGGTVSGGGAPSSGGSSSSGSYDSGGILAPSGDAGTIDLGDLGGGAGIITDDLPAFATGGQFTVQGSGGTDSQLVQFMATPGEVVTVSTPGGGTQTAGASPLAAANDNGSSSGTFADNIVSQTDEMTAKFAQNLAGQTDTLTKKADATTGRITAAIAAQTTALENFWTDLQAKAFPASTTPSSTMGTSGVTSAAGTSETLGTPAEMFAQSPLYSRYANAMPWWMSGQPLTIGSVTNGTGATGNALGSWLNQNPNGAPSRSAPSRSSSAVSSRSSSSAVPSQDYSSNGTSTDLSQGGMFVPPGGYSGTGSSSSSFPITDASGSISDYSGASYDYSGGGSYDMAGGDAYYGGAFATGGSFTVPGSGGVDKTLVAIHATAGETVSVQQPGASSGGGGGSPVINVTVNATDLSSFIKSEPQLRTTLLRALRAAEKSL